MKSCHGRVERRPFGRTDFGWMVGIDGRVVKPKSVFLLGGFAIQVSVRSPCDDVGEGRSTVGEGRSADSSRIPASPTVAASDRATVQRAQTGMKPLTVSALGVPSAPGAGHTGHEHRAERTVRGQSV